MPVKTTSHERLSLKFGAEDGLEEGQFVAYAAVFDVKDSHGDIIRKGAFKDTLADWAKGDAPIPVLYGHDFSDLHNNIGYVLKAEEDDRGLKVTAQLDLDTPNGKQAHRLISQKRLTDLSFAFDVEDYKVHNAKGEDEGYTELLKLGLYEVSAVPIGANRETGFLAVKQSAQKVAAAAGRVNAAKNDGDLSAALISLAEKLSLLGKELGAKDAPSTETHDDTAQAEQEQIGSEEPGKAKDADPVPAKASAEYMERKLKFYSLRAGS